MARLQEPLNPPGPAKAGVLQDQRVGWQGTQHLWHQRHFRAEAGSQGRPHVRMRANLQHREQTHLRKGTVRAWLVVLGASSEGPIVLRRFADVEELAVDGHQPSTKAESSRRRRLAQRLARQPHQQPQRSYAQRAASIAQSRRSRQALRRGLLAQPAQSAGELAPHALQGHGGQHGPGDEQVDHDHMIELAFPVLPAMQIVQHLAHQCARIDLFQHRQRDLLGHLVRGHLLQYRRRHRKGAFLSRSGFFILFTRKSPFCLPLSLFEWHCPQGVSLHFSPSHDDGQNTSIRGKACMCSTAMLN